MDPKKVTIPSLKDLTIDSITENVKLVNSTNASPRFKFLLERLVFQAIQFLTATGQICTDVRQEFILLSDILGLSLLVDSIDHQKPTSSTEGTFLGPFHTHDAEHLDNGSLTSHDQNGEPLLAICTVKDIEGNPIAGVKIDIWETDRPECNFWFKGIVPVPYPIPHDGPVGKLLMKLNRHPMRPSHMHFMFEKESWDKLVTALYLRGDPYETSDAVFSVKESLIVELGQIDAEMASKYPGAHEGMKLLQYDFVLVTEEETANLRGQRSVEALKKLNMSVKFVDGLPVPDVD
ncbi:hypothetical protein FOVG_19880 [Fusarium oxysporum f. sp. pisi HDV247]|uniref:Uncharacterized protein n=1 Tax=Fusarium oxysporum f. sp. pisi HDV247 TaxID=1080344 RepID=W9NCT4_FUSOX|nr:hypothetical protein FOVG_19880 [Fusarium oxysporum f. sp. pisi HDV247]